MHFEFRERKIRKKIKFNSSVEIGVYFGLL
jgi:hypothetical protein